MGKNQLLQRVGSKATAVMDGVGVSLAGESLPQYHWCTLKHQVKKKIKKNTGINVLSSRHCTNTLFRDSHPGVQLSGFELQLITKMNFPQGTVRASPVPSPPCLQLTQLPSPSDGSIFTYHHQGCSGARQVLSTVLPAPLARCKEGSSQL